MEYLEGGLLLVHSSGKWLCGDGAANWLRMDGRPGSVSDWATLFPSHRHDQTCFGAYPAAYPADNSGSFSRGSGGQIEKLPTGSVL